jgi:hypothetical protein
MDKTHIDCRATGGIYDDMRLLDVSDFFVDEFQLARHKVRKL